MPKKCIICDGEATYMVKGSSEFYCGECAQDYFSDMNLLESLNDILLA
ncbi:MAG: hypothetical protein ABIH34_01800 [Nanoarchaeota archaeon]